MFVATIAALTTLPFALIPRPMAITVGAGELILHERDLIAVSQRLAPEEQQLERGLDMVFNISGHGQPNNKIAVKPDLGPELGDEGYHLKVTPDGFNLEAATSAGIFYGIQTIRQMAQHDAGDILLHSVEIKDKPRFAWRGIMLDCARHFWQTDFIKRLLDYMALYKLNTFHWHLTDDQGWRIQIKKYPRLTSVGSMRSASMDSDRVVRPGAYGGYYTQEEIKEIVAYATVRHITVVPEIEMPGHSRAALAAYPEYSCTGGPFEVSPRWGVHQDILCPGQEKTFDFVTDILDEVMELFPSKYIHVGGDEAPKLRWNACPRCQARIKSEGLKNANELQSYFERRIDRYLDERGRKLVGWDEILEGGLAQNATVMSWHSRAGGLKAAQAGHDAVMTPYEFCYFDKYQADPAGEPKAIGGYLPLQKVYSNDPTPELLTPDQAKHILGVQANVWTEFIGTPERVEYMIFPRALALAEVAWTPQRMRNYDDFFLRLKKNLPLLDGQGLVYRRLTPMEAKTLVFTKAPPAKVLVPVLPGSRLKGAQSLKGKPQAKVKPKVRPTKVLR